MNKPTNTQTDPIAIGTTEAITGTVFNLDSEIMGEQRHYWVYLPPSYKKEDARDRRYPVVVHLDGQSHGSWSPTTAQYMFQRKRAPEFIVIGVHNMNPENGLTAGERARDLTPTHSLMHYDGQPNEIYRLSGGADRFMRFLVEELLPVIDRDYRTQPHRAIVGQSLSGCFALNAFLTGAPAFQAYVAMDPCLWWDNDRAKRMTAELSPGSDIFERGLFVAFSGTDDNGRRAQQAWFDQLAGKATESDRRHLRFAHYPDESHISMNLRGFYEGVSFVLGESCGLNWNNEK